MSNQPQSPLFCTPEQGKRLKELSVGGDSYFVWAEFGNPCDIMLRESTPYYADKPVKFYPALTLQELRDMVWGMFWKEYQMYENSRGGYSGLRGWKDAWADICHARTAPELAAWIIERMEEDRG